MKGESVQAGSILRVPTLSARRVQPPSTRERMQTHSSREIDVVKKGVRKKQQRGLAGSDADGKVKDSGGRVESVPDLQKQGCACAFR